MPGQRRIVRVLVVDESMTARKWVAKTLQPDPEITVIAEAGSGQSAVGAIVQRRPDVIVIGRGTLLGSAGALSKALALHRAPIIAVAEPGEDCTGLASLEGVPSGAVQVFERPRASEDRALWHRRFLNAIRAASGVSVVRHVSGAAQTPKPSLHRGGGGEIEIVAIGTSAGGPKTVARLLSALPPLPAPVVLVMHFPGKMFESLLDWLSSVSIMPVAAVAEGSSLDALAGTVSIAVPGRHLIVRRRRFVFDDGPRRHYCKPAVDPLFESIALEYGSRSAAVLLTGMGYDGAEGLLEIRRAGGVTIAQDEATSDVWGMPKAAIDVGAAEHILPDHEIPGFLTGLFQPIRCGT